MPTYGFVMETVEDRLHERGGDATPKSVPLPECPICGVALSDGTAMAAHLGSAHPLIAPRLIVDGHVVVGERIVHSAIDVDSLEVTNAETITMISDGGSPREVSALELREVVGGATSSTFDLVLANRRAAGGGAAIERVRLVVDVTESALLDEADRLFQDTVASDGLDEFVLDEFAQSVSNAGPTTRYASALHEYGVAVMVKDRHGGGGSALPFDVHRRKLQSANHVLRAYPQRPLARAICGFAQFSLNDFGAGRPTTGVPDLDRCVATLRGALGVPGGLPSTAPTDALGGRCPTDLVTAAILQTWDEPDLISTLAQVANGPGTTPEDVAKCRVLAALNEAPGSSIASDLLRPLMNDPVFGALAEQIIETPRTDV